MRIISSLLLCSTVLAGVAVAQPAKSTASEPKAVIHTSMGDIHCTLFPSKAPMGVANFIGLARGTKDWTHPASGAKKHGVALYDGTTFHRVIPNFMIQGGDPLGTGEGEPGFRFGNETSKDLTFDRPGRFAYANAGPNTNGSQFFITEVAVPRLNGNFTIFGQCSDEELVKKIARVPRNAADKPRTQVVIKHIDIINGSAPARPATKPAPKKPSAATKAG